MDENPYQSPQTPPRVPPKRPAKLPGRPDYRKLPTFILLFSVATAAVGGMMLPLPERRITFSFFGYAIVLASLGIGLFVRALRKERERGG